MKQVSNLFAARAWLYGVMAALWLALSVVRFRLMASYQDMAEAGWAPGASRAESQMWLGIVHAAVAVAFTGVAVMYARRARREAGSEPAHEEVTKEGA